MLELGSHQLLTLDSIYSLGLIYCSSLTLPPCVSYSCMHCLAVYSFALLLPLTLALSALLLFLINAMFSDPIYKTPLHVIIQHFRISTLILILIVYLTLL